MKQLKPNRRLLTAAIAALALGCINLSSCDDASDDSDDILEAAGYGDSAGKIGGGAAAGLSAEFKTQGGTWITQSIPKNFWDSVINDDATVNLPSAYIQRPGMIFLGWYDIPQPFSETPQAQQAQIEVPTEDDGQKQPESLSEPAPYLLSDDAVPEEGLFSESTKLTASVTLYAWWQRLEPGAKIVTFIPYWIEGAQGFKRQALPQEDGATYKIAQNNFPKVAGGPEHYYPVGEGGAEIADKTTWWTEPVEGTAFKAETNTQDSMTVYGHWAGDRYTVRFHSNTPGELNNPDVGASAIIDKDVLEKEVVYPGSAILEAEDIKRIPDGYTLLGWFKEQKPLIQTAGGAPAANDPRWFKPGVTTVTEDTDVYGLWESRPANSYRVTIKGSFDDRNAIATVYASAGNNYMINNLSSYDNVIKWENYDRDGRNWYYTPEQGGNATGAEFYTDTVIRQDIIVFAKWKGKSYTVTFKRLEGEQEERSVTYPDKLSKYFIPAVGTAEHSTSNGKWYNANGGAEFTEDTEITGNITVTPRWIGNTYTITFDGNGGAPSGYTVSVKYPDNIMIKNPVMWLGELPPINPKKYNDEFTGWRTTTIGGIPVTEESVISANAVYYAKWLDIPEGWTWNPGLHELSKTFGCTGGVQQFTVINEGRYTFELFGAAGGKNGGKGGYSKGTLANLGEGTTLYIYVGGKGDTASGLAGWNGGGAGNGHSSYGGGGGGATDVRFETELNTRVIVAGGGGGGGDYLGGNGGGLSGGKGSGPSADDSYYGGKGATASEAGKGNGPSNTYGAGGYGYGGAATYSNGYPGGGGGGGYWGGGGGYAYGGGGGGSGFIYGYSETPGDPSKPLPSKYRIYPFTSDMSCIQGGGSTGDGQVKVTWRPRS